MPGITRSLRFVSAEDSTQCLTSSANTHDRIQSSCRTWRSVKWVARPNHSVPPSRSRTSRCGSVDWRFSNGSASRSRLRYLCVLLVGSLVIIPAATAKRLARSLRGMLIISVAVSVASTTIGTLLSFALHRTPGSMIVLVAAGFFVVSLGRRPSA